MKIDFKKMFLLLNEARTVAIVGHIRPDGDCIGSSLALRLALLAMGKKTADVFIDDTIPDSFGYHSEINQIKDKEFISSNSWQNYDLVVILDSSTEDRIGRCTQLRGFAKKILVVDHHINTYLKGDEIVTSSKYVSVGEILYEFFLEHKIEITADIATWLYTSIATDTGCFMQANTTSSAHRAAAELIDKGIGLETINYNNFRLYNRKILPGLWSTLRKIKFFSCGEIAVINIPYKTMKKYQLAGEIHQFKKYASEASGVRIGIIITERNKKEFNVSLRSHGDADVAAVAQVFGGGGHKNASGFIVHGKYKKVLSDILAQVEKCLTAF